MGKAHAQLERDRNEQMARNDRLQNELVDARARLEQDNKWSFFIISLFVLHRRNNRVT